MELIPGFNLTYNDALPDPPPSPKPQWEPPPKAPVLGVAHFPRTAERAALKRAGKAAASDVVERARARPDGKALRAADGAVLRVPYVVRLKSR